MSMRRSIDYLLTARAARASPALLLALQHTAATLDAHGQFTAPSSSSANQTAGSGSQATAGSGTPTAATGSGSAPNRPHPLVQRILRSDLAAEEATAALYRAQQVVLGRRPDLAAFQDRERQHAESMRNLAPQHRTRPSLLAPALKAGFWALGVASALAPRQLSAAVTAGVQDALTDVCNEQLRELREQGLSDEAAQVRQAVIAMRDEEREVEGSPPVPDVMALQRLNQLSPPEALAAVVKFGTRTAIDLAGKL